MRYKPTNGLAFIELIVALTLITSTILASIPLFTKVRNDLNRGLDDSISSALTMENIIAELSGGRAIIHPRAKTGARRAISLIFLDRLNHIGLIFCDGNYLWLKKYNPATGEFSKSKLGYCSSIIFHDRGRTRRCLRIRTVLGSCPLATTVVFRNSPLAQLPQFAELPLIKEAETNEI